MKKALFLLLGLGLLTSPAMADQVNKASFTLTNETAYIAARNLNRIVVGVTSTAGFITVFNSTFTTALPISSMSLTAGNILDFDNLQVKGIYYRTAGNTGGVTIIYRN